jgi:hypothetical protein
MNRNIVTLLTVLFFSLQSFSNTSCKNSALPKLQLVKTSLQVTVRNNLGNLEEGAEVKLYKTDADYQNDTNMVAKMTTDEKGRAKFTELESIIYFLDVRKGDMNNFGAGIQTDTLAEKRMNKVTIIIE